MPEDKKRRARRRGLGRGQILAVVGGVVVLAGLVIFFSLSQIVSPTPTLPTGTAYGVEAGVTPDGEPRLGSASAPLTLIDYSDFQ